MSDFSIPDAIEPLVGWRYWRFDFERGRLLSLAGPHAEWRPGQALQAGCRFRSIDPTDRRFQLVTGYATRPHASPGEGCTCGIYAAKDLTQLRRHALFGLGRMVVGEVSLWGTVIPGRRGYRAEYGYPSRLFVSDRTATRHPAVLGGLEAYGVTVEVVPDRLAIPQRAAVTPAPTGSARVF